MIDIDCYKLYHQLKDMRKLKQHIQHTYKRVSCRVRSEIKKIDKLCADLESETLQSMDAFTKKSVFDVLNGVKHTVRSFENIQQMSMRMVDTIDSACDSAGGLLGDKCDRDMSTQTDGDSAYSEAVRDHNQDLMVIKNDYQNRFYEILNNTDVTVQIQSFHRISQPFSTQTEPLNPFIARMSGKLVSLNNKLDKVVINFNDRPKIDQSRKSIDSPS